MQSIPSKIFMYKIVKPWLHSFNSFNRRKHISSFILNLMQLREALSVSSHLDRIHNNRSQHLVESCSTKKLFFKIVDQRRNVHFSPTGVPHVNGAWFSIQAASNAGPSWIKGINWNSCIKYPHYLPLFHHKIQCVLKLSFLMLPCLVQGTICLYTNQEYMSDT